MTITKTNNSKNGTNRKPRWKRPKEKKKYTEAEMRLIETSREVLKIIREMKEEGAFDDILKTKVQKYEPTRFRYECFRRV